MTQADDDIHFPELARAARRLELDEMELVEAMLSALDSGLGYWTALHSVVAEAAQRKGVYDGEVKARIDSGDIYSSRPAPVPATVGRMMVVVADGQIDVFDALSFVGARQDADRQNTGESEHERRRLAKLAAVKANGETKA